MSDYPELDGYESTPDIADKDLAARERELLGEAGAAELVGSSNEVELLSEDEVPIPSANSSTSHIAEEPKSEKVVPGAGPSAYIPKKVDLSESEFLKDWKVKRDLEIERRDKVSNEKNEATKEKARKAIDDFYENYNSKKEKEASKVHEDAEEFVKKRDAEIGSGEGTTWDRIAKLMDGLGRPAEGVEARDKQRFADLVQGLKGDANAPGAGGY